MADETKKYLVNVESNLKKYAEDAANAGIKVKLLEGELANLKEGGRASAAQIEAHAAALRNAQKEYRQTKSALDILTKATKEGSTERDKLNAIVTVETTKLKLLGDGYTRNSKGLLTLNPQYAIQKKAVADANKALIDYDLSINKGGTNVGRYAESLGGLAGKFASIPGPIGAAAGGVKALSLSFKALLVNPVVLVITALVTVLGGLVKAFKSTAEGAGKIKDVMASFHAILNVLRERVVSVIDSFQHLFKGEFKAAAEDMKNAFSGIASEIKNASSAAAELSAMQRQLTKELAFHISEEANENNLIQKYLYLAKDKSKSDNERINYLKQSLELGKENAGKEVEYSKRQFDIDVKNAALKANIDEQSLARWIALDAEQQKTALEGSEKLQKAYNLLGGSEAVKQLEESYAKIIISDTAFFQHNKRAVSQLSTLLEELKTEKEKIAQENIKMLQQESKDQISLRLALAKGDLEATKKALKFQYDTEIANSELTNTQKELLHANYLNAIAELNKTANDKWNEDTKKAGEDKLAIETELNSMRLDAAENNLDLQEQIIDQEYKSLKKSDQWKKLSMLDQIKVEREYAKAKKQISKDRISQYHDEVSATADALGAISEVVGKETIAGKGFAVAQATINAFLAGSKALTDPTIPSTYLRIATMIAVIATGLANVRNILAVDTSGGGGSSSASSTSTASSAISAASARITAPTVSGTGTSILSPAGQITQSTQTAAEIKQLTASDIATAMKDVTIVTTIEDINAKQKSTNKVTRRATI